MQYNDDAQLDTSVVEDGRSGGIGLGGLAAGGGGLGIIGVIVVVLMNVLGGGGSSGLPGGLSGLSGVGGSGVSSVDDGQLAASCRTGKDANTRTDCAVVADIESIEDYWQSELGSSYTHAPTRFFRGQTSTGCGAADSGVGPFYCPADKRVYIDLSFFDELRTRFGATGGAFVNAYVLAHEYGHHVQDLLGVESRIDQTSTGPASDSVRLELQADCYAGVWAHSATTVPGPDGQPLITSINRADVSAALDTAGRIGDDWIQTHLGSGQVNQSQFTHGTSAQREKWFSTGYSTGAPPRCDTFSAGSLG